MPLSASHPGYDQDLHIFYDGLITRFHAHTLEAAIWLHIMAGPACPLPTPLLVVMHDSGPEHQLHQIELTKQVIDLAEQAGLSSCINLPEGTEVPQWMRESAVDMDDPSSSPIQGTPSTT